jgi:hypothetical protein
MARAVQGVGAAVAAAAAAGAMQASQQLGAALGVAILVSLFAGVASGTATAQPEAFSAGVADAFIAGTAFAVQTLLLVVFAVRPAPVRDADTP